MRPCFTKRLTDATRIIKLTAGLLSRQPPCVLIRSHIRILVGGTRRQSYPPFATQTHD